MIRNLKALGLTLVAVFALSALAASSASAATFTSPGGYPQTLVTEDVGAEDLFTVNGNELTCTGETFDGTLTGPVASLEVTPTYVNCKTKGAAFNNVTVTHNGCNFKFTWVETVETDWDKVSVEVVCPEGKVIEIHHYKDEAHKETKCTNTVGPQKATGTLNATSLTASNDVLLEGTVTVNVQTHGTCSFGLTVGVASEYHASTTVKTASGARVHVG